MDRCPRHDQCVHAAKLRITRSGCCVDCGTVVARSVKPHLSARTGRVIAAMNEYGRPVAA